MPKPIYKLSARQRNGVAWLSGLSFASVNQWYRGQHVTANTRLRIMSVLAQVGVDVGTDVEKEEP